METVSFHVRYVPFREGLVCMDTFGVRVVNPKVESKGGNLCVCTPVQIYVNPGDEPNEDDPNNVATNENSNDSNDSINLIE